MAVVYSCFFAESAQAKQQPCDGGRPRWSSGLIRHVFSFQIRSWMRKWVRNQSMPSIFSSPSVHIPIDKSRLYWLETIRHRLATDEKRRREEEKVCRRGRALLPSNARREVLDEVDWLKMMRKGDCNERI